MSKLNPLDLTIIKYLLQDGRMSFAEIAGECGVTKNKIWKRYTSMARKGIVTGATVQMNFAKFGYDAVVTFLVNVETHQLEQVMAHIGKITEVHAYRQYNNIYNIRAFAALKDLNELDRLGQVIKRMLPTVSMRTHIWTDVRNIPENLSLNSLCRDNDRYVLRCLEKLDHKRSYPIGIDELDSLIVKKLTLDGRASFAEIAKEVGTSIDTVVKRYHKLRNNGAVKVSIQIDPNKIGYSSILDFNISFNCAQNLSNSVVESLAKIPDVVVITKISGDYDLQMTAMVRDVEHSFEIQDQIGRTCGVTKIEVSARRIPTGWPTPQQHISTM